MKVNVVPWSIADKLPGRQAKWPGIIISIPMKFIIWLVNIAFNALLKSVLELCTLLQQNDMEDDYLILKCGNVLECTQQTAVDK